MAALLTPTSSPSAGIMLLDTRKQHSVGQIIIAVQGNGTSQSTEDGTD